MAAQLVTKINRYIGTAAEIAAMTLTGIPTGSTFFESDTGILKVLNAAGALVTAPSESVQLSGSNATDKDGTSLNGSMVKDGDGYGVLRVVDAAPFGYDSNSDSIKVSNGYRQVDVTIAQNGTVSTEIDFRGYKYLSFLMPAGWDDATLTIKGSPTAGGTKVDIVNDSGVTFGAMTVAVDKIYVVDTQALMIAGLPYLALIASAPQTTADRVIKVMLKA